MEREIHEDLESSFVEASHEDQAVAGLEAHAAQDLGVAAQDSQIPEDHFNQAMAEVKVGSIEEAHASWQRVFDLSYAHQDAPETSSFFQKKLMFARLLKDAGKCDERGLDLLERQLMGWYTHHHITDASFWGIRKVPAFEEVLDLTREYYRAMGRTQAEWSALLDSIGPEIDDDGRAFMETMRQLDS